MNAQLRHLTVLAAAVLLSACKIQVDVPSSGGVTTESGGYSCAANESCTVDVYDIHFNETFVAEPGDGFEFVQWKYKDGAVCGGLSTPCWLFTAGLENSEQLMAILESPDSVYYLEPQFRSTGFNSLFIGHSFFRPFAEAMEGHAAAVGMTEHEQSVVFNGGANGAPEALWNNPSKRSDIQAVLDTGEVELFVMTYHPDYPTLIGYQNWIDYALEQNPATRFAVALPWGTQPAEFDTEAYANAWHEFRTTTFYQGIDALRSRYPGTDIFAIPYGQAAIELRILFDAGQLPAVNALTGDSATSIFTDSLGHAGEILIALGELVWLRAIYGVDLDDYPHETDYEVDLKSLAQDIMDAHDPRYDAPYH